MVSLEMTQPQAHDGRPVGADSTHERLLSPRFVDDIFVDAVDIKAINTVNWVYLHTSAAKMGNK